MRKLLGLVFGLSTMLIGACWMNQLDWAPCDEPSSVYCVWM